MTESLYRLALIYLRNHPNLINFTKLNHQTTADMFETIKDEEHLIGVRVCRAVYNWGAIYSYLVKYHSNNSSTCHIKKPTNPIDITNLESYIDGLYITPNGIYEPSTNTLHQTFIFGEAVNKYKLINNEIYLKLQHIFTKIDITEYNQNIFSGYHGPSFLNIKLQNTVCDNKLLRRHPDVLEWAILNDHVSEKLFIYKDLLETLL